MPPSTAAHSQNAKRKTLIFIFHPTFPTHRHEWESVLRSRPWPTCLISGSRVRSIDFVFTSCSSREGLRHSSRKPAIDFISPNPLYSYHKLPRERDFHSKSSNFHSRSTREKNFCDHVHSQSANRAKNTSEVIARREKIEKFSSFLCWGKALFSTHARVKRSSRLIAQLNTIKRPEYLRLHAWVYAAAPPIDVSALASASIVIIKHIGACLVQKHSSRVYLRSPRSHCTAALRRNFHLCLFH